MRPGRFRVLIRLNLPLPLVMGHVEADLRILSSAAKALTVKALVDTGATFTVIPRSIARELDLNPRARR